MKKIILLTVLVAIFTTIIYAEATDYIVFKEGNSFIAQNRINGRVAIKNTNADVVLQQLLNYLQDFGGNIELMSGDYPIQNQLKIPSHVTICGKGASTVVLIKKTAQIESAFYSDSTSKITIKSLMIISENPKAKHTGIIFNHVGDCLVKDVAISGMGAYGVWYRDRTFLSEIRGCKISDSGVSGIFFQGLSSKSRAGDFVPNLITNCIIYGGNYGIELESSLVTNIVACEVYMSQSVGFYLHDHSNSTLISGCRTFQIQDDAVRVVSSYELNVSSNIFCWHEGHGIVLDNVIWGNVNGNNFIDNGHINIFPKNLSQDEKLSYSVLIPDSINVIDSLKCGIYAINGTKGVTISGNAIFNWGTNAPLKHGIQEDSSCSENIITGNNINYSNGLGILSEGTNSVISNNISTEKMPYLGEIDSKNQRFHRFDPRKIQKFIEETRRPYLEK